MIIKGKNFFKNNINNRLYNINVCNNDNKINDMINYFNFYQSLESELIIGIDFEFNRSLDNTMREIALFQINLEHDMNTNKETKIFLFYPPDLNNNQLDVVKKLLTSRKIKKIIHGGEALDIPYLFNNLIKDNQEQIDFCKNLYDTKYLCEFYNQQFKKDDFKCKIYLLLKQMEIISDEQYESLLQNEEKMGPIYNIRIDVKNLSEELINYSAYDVLYLPQLFKAFPVNVFYHKLIPEITSINYILKQTDFFKNHLEHYSKFNNYFLVIDNSKLNLIDIYNFMYYWIKHDHINDILEITYFKKYFQIILKSIVYYYINKNYDVYEKNNILNEIKVIKLKHILDKTKDFKYVRKFLKKMNYTIKKELV